MHRENDVRCVPVVVVRIVRLGGESQHRARHGADRTDHDAVDHREDEDRRQNGDEQGQEDDVARVDQQFVAQSCIRQHDLEVLRRGADPAMDAQHAVAAGDQRRQRGHDGAERRRVRTELLTHHGLRLKNIANYIL